jgi:integrase/recombinase XerD
MVAATVITSIIGLARTGVAADARTPVPVRLVIRFQQYAGDYPWTWRPADLEDFLAERRSGERPIALATLRADANAIGMFCAYAASPIYGWPEFCEHLFGDVPAQICFDWNTPAAHHR